MKVVVGALWVNECIRYSLHINRLLLLTGTAHYETPHLGLHGLLSILWILDIFCRRNFYYLQFYRFMGEDIGLLRI